MFDELSPPQSSVFYHSEYLSGTRCRLISKASRYTIGRAADDFLGCFDKIVHDFHMSRMLAPGGQRPSTYQDWFIQVDEDLANKKSTSEGNATPHIFRVPIQIREVSTDSFNSKFPFGLYDLETRPDSVLDTYRKYFAEIFMQITGKGWKKICSEVVGDSTEDVKSWVKLYDGLQLDSITVGKANPRVGDPPKEGNGKEKLDSQNGSLSQAELRRIDFIRSWLTLDAITIVCFIRADHERVCPKKLCQNKHFPQLEEAMKIKTLKAIVHMIRLDIFKFENQIPLPLIRNVVTMMADGDKTPALFRKFVVDAVMLIYCELPGPRTLTEFENSVNSIDIDECKHLLQCLYLVICPNPNPQDRNLGQAPTEAGPSQSVQSDLLHPGAAREEAGPSEAVQSDLSHLAAATQFSTRGSDNILGEDKEKVTESRPPNPPAIYEPIAGRAEPGTGGTPATGHGQEEAEPHSLKVNSEVANLGKDQGSSGTPSAQILAPAAGSSWSASIFKCVQSFRRPGGHHECGSAPESAQHPETALLVDPSSNVSQQRNPGGAQEQLQGAPGTSGSRGSKIELVGFSPHQSDAGGGHTSQYSQAQASTGDGNSKESHYHHPLITHVPTVTHLKEAGISVIVGQGDLETKCISDVKFRKSSFQGKLYIPAIGVYDETESLLRNLLTYEYVVEDKKDLLSFVYLMDNLIDTEQDVKMMMDSGVLKNKSLGSDARVAEMWNTLLTGVVLKLSPHCKILFYDISKHYHNKWSNLVEEFTTIHLRKPWVVVSGFLVAIGLIATLIATVYTTFTYYDGNKQRVQT